MPRTPQGLKPVFVLYHKNCLPAMTPMLTTGNFRIFDFYDQVRACYPDTHNLPVDWQRALINLNTPDDVRSIAKEPR
ncbi:hypothetical protein [Geoalkalibacter halelectricus]|uniref:hypothetical protein n=1 Tax=Geoalkalibacter halelectricus TaxID=2847045 RepID=UPI003D248FB3